LPQVWAWRRSRVKALKKYVDTLICTLPFEPEFYAGYEVKTHFVGHPMLDEISPPVDASSLKRYFLPPGCVTLIGLLPGSRNGEVKEILPTLLMTADVIRSKMPQVGFIIPIAPNLNDNFIRTAIGDRKYIATVSGRSHDVMSCADFIITKSGTSTLETALFDVPAAVVYKAQFLSYWSAIYIVNLKTAALPNLIAGKDVVREFYQYEFIPENVANHVLEMLGSQSMISERKKWMEIVRQKLGEKGAAKRAATIIINRMKELFKKEGLHVS
jgi:lipid-A-disaccharide synthase